VKETAVDFAKALGVKVKGKLGSYDFSWTVLSVVGKVLSLQLNFEGDIDKMGYLRGGNEKVEITFKDRSKFSAFLQEDEVSNVAWLFQTLTLEDKSAEAKVALVVKRGKQLLLLRRKHPSRQTSWHCD